MKKNKKENNTQIIDIEKIINDRTTFKNWRVF